MTTVVTCDRGGLSGKDTASKRLNDTPADGKKSGGASVETALSVVIFTADGIIGIIDAVVVMVCAGTAPGTGSNSIAFEDYSLIDKVMLS